jgi:hypothetical protein
VTIENSNAFGLEAREALHAASEEAAFHKG